MSRIMELGAGLLPAVIIFCGAGCASFVQKTKSDSEVFVLNYDTPLDSALQTKLVAVDASLRGQYGMATGQTAVGLLDLRGKRLAMIDPDRMEYGASVPKIGILLAYFQLHPEAGTYLQAQTRHELGLMIKVSDNEMATKYSRQLGLKRIQEVLNDYGFYDAKHGGGLWVGKHYGQSDERYGDPVANHSHGATVRQLLRYYLLLEQERLVSMEASKAMLEIFASPDIPHLNDKFVKGLAAREVQVWRKSGWWEDWFHDTAIVRGPRRHYILVAMTHHPKGEAYLESLARAMDEWMMNNSGR